MSLRPFYHEAQIRAGDTDLRLVVNMLTIDAIEGLVGIPMPSIVPQFLTREPVPLALQAKVVWGLLREHHKEVTLDEAAGLAFGDQETATAVGVALGDLFLRSGLIVLETDKGKPKGQNPRRRRGVSKAS